MSNWQTSEEKALNHLNNKYGGGFGCQFSLIGGSNSTSSDILVRNKFSEFFLEIKTPISQFGQFVVDQDSNSRTFKFSDKNKTDLNGYSEKFLRFMNNDFNLFSKAGTKGEIISVTDQVLYSYIVDYYKAKGVKFFIVSDKEFIIFPIEKLSYYFKITAKCRNKKSGSRRVSKNGLAKIKSIIKLEFSPEDIYFDGGRSLLKSEKCLNNCKAFYDNCEYMLRKRDEGLYEIRALSKTSNPTVIFNGKLKATQNHDDLKTFEEFLLS